MPVLNSTALRLSDDGSKLLLVQSAGQQRSAWVEGTKPIPARTWIHVAATVTAGTASIYVNGELDASGPSPGPPVASANPISLGGKTYGSGQQDGLVGALRQVRVWKRALGPEELRAVAQSYLTGDEEDLQAYWPLDDGAGVLARDRSPNRAALTLASTEHPPDLPTWWRIGRGGPYFVLEEIPLPSSVVGWFSPYAPRIGGFCPIDLNTDRTADVFLFTSYGLDSRPMPQFALLNDGAGNLGDATPSVIGDTKAIALGPLASDLDGDGRQDLVSGDFGMDLTPFSGGQSRVVLQSADGRLRDVTSTRIPQVRAATHNLAVADVNGDGLTDVLMCNIGCGRVGTQLFINEGGGRMRPASGLLPEETVYPSGDVGYFTRASFTSAAFLDVDRNGTQDLLLGWGGGPNASADGADWLLLNDGTGRFSRAAAAALPRRAGDASWVTLSIDPADFDRDGWGDILLSLTASEYNNAFLQLLLNNGDGTFRDGSPAIPQEWPSGGAFLTSSAKASPVDINGDGWIDILATGNAGARLFMNQDGRSFLDLTALLPVGRYSAPGVPIVLREGHNPDIVLLGWEGHSYYILRNQVPYSLEPPGKVRRGLRGRRP